MRRQQSGGDLSQAEIVGRYDADIVDLRQQARRRIVEQDQLDPRGGYLAERFGHRGAADRNADDRVELRLDQPLDRRDLARRIVAAVDDLDDDGARLPQACFDARDLPLRPVRGRRVQNDGNAEGRARASSTISGESTIRSGVAARSPCGPSPATRGLGGGRRVGRRPPGGAVLSSRGMPAPPVLLFCGSMSHQPKAGRLHCKGRDASGAADPCAG